jgi:uncharacterized protein (DUF58 family)
MLECLRLLPPETTAKFGRLEWLARGAVEGFVTGRHRSPHKGFSVEFAEHRQYTRGDDLRDLDWRVYGKCDRYYIKQYIEETNLRATLVVDASGSMAYTGERAARLHGRSVSKFQYAQLTAAALAYLFIRQQDAVGLVTFDRKVRRYLPARGEAGQLRRILQELHDTEPGGETDPSAIFHDIAERIHRRGVVIILSDLFGDPSAIVNALHHFRYRRHEVTVFHIMADEELTFPFDKVTHFRDLEAPGRALPIDPKALRAEYLERLGAFVDQIETNCGRMRADYAPMTTREPYDRAIADWLARRRSLR